MVPLDEDELSGRRDNIKKEIKFIIVTRIVHVRLPTEALVIMDNQLLYNSLSKLAPVSKMYLFIYLGGIYVIATLGRFANALSIFEYIGMSYALNYLFEGQYWPSVFSYMFNILAVQEFVCVVLLLYGTLKLSVLYYMCLFVLVKWYGVDDMTTVLQVITLIAIPCQVTHGILLFYGAIEEVVWALEASIWFCLAVAAYNTILGVMGGIYFIRHGERAVHFFIAALFCLMGFSLFAVLCYDIVIIYSLKKTIAFAPPLSETLSNVEISTVNKS